MGIADIKSIGVVGAGTMGQGITISCALAGYESFLFDINSQFCDTALQSIYKMLEQLTAKGRITMAEAENASTRIKKANQLLDLKVDLIIEAVIENLEIKKKLFADLEEINSGHVILATNTSSISVTEIASGLRNPSQCIGLHFFNPAHVMKLVEVISGSHSNREVVSRVKEFVNSIGKVPVEAKDSPGFIVNRVARHFYVESLKVMEEEVASFETIDQLIKSAGFKMGPFELMDLIGIDINYAVTASVYEGFNQAVKFKPSDIQYQKIKAGFLGRKTGRGFYEYAKK